MNCTCNNGKFCTCQGLHKIDTSLMPVEMYEPLNQPFDWIDSYARPFFYAAVGVAVGATFSLVYLVRQFN